MAGSCGFAPPPQFFRDPAFGFCSPAIGPSSPAALGVLRLQRRDLCGRNLRCGRAERGGLTARAGGEKGAQGSLVRTLLIDNYDSYTYNIYQELSVVNGLPPIVIYNDEWTWEYICQQLYEDKAFDNIVISPGPGSPTCLADIGICLQLLIGCEDIPILGVCLGHQALGFVHGAQIIHAPEPIHGRLSEVEHNHCELFTGIPSGRNSRYKVVRYHSLVVDWNTLPKVLIPTAWATSSKTLSFLDVQDPDICSSKYYKEKNLPPSGKYPNILMGIRHVTRPHYGVQFHPESIATCYGRRIFENFKSLTVNYGLRSVQHPARKSSHKLYQPDASTNGNSLTDPGPSLTDHLHSKDQSIPSSNPAHVKHLKLHWKKFHGLAKQVGGSKNIFLELFGSENGNDTFWLDSSSTEKRRARFSFMGGKGGHMWKQLSFWLLEPRNPASGCGGHLEIRDSRGSTSRMFLKEGFLDFMDKEIQSFQYDKGDYEGLPFDFCGGFVGFIGYNLKIECGAQSNLHKSSTPDACLFFADNIIALDHSNDDVYILSLCDATQISNSVSENLDKKSWLEETEKRLLTLKASSTNPDHKEKMVTPPVSHRLGFVVERSELQYVRDVQDCLRLIRDGESYELCLTTQMRRKVKDINALKLYCDLRHQNPAPYAAWLNFSKDNLSICCSSPERFLQLDGSGILEAKPIKGTIRRGSTTDEDERLRLQLQYSEKDQAENLMIVDLLRNDLGRVCESGTVHVPRLMEVESYATVHTLVSTIRGKKQSALSPIECIKAAFPGGSMTGAPKLRSMEILDSIETCSRGVYSGSIGYFSYNKTFDLNIVIRTVVIHNEEASIGAGGAVVALSNPEEEYKEMLLKARAPTQAVEKCLRNSDPNSDPCPRRFIMTT